MNGHPFLSSKLMQIYFLLILSALLTGYAAPLPRYEMTKSNLRAIFPRELDGVTSPRWQFLAE
jgi:hypothetical protein